jgi:preprotein translocase subunit YajC
MLFINFLEDAAPAAGGGGMQLIIMLVLMFAIMYFFMIRPQKKRQKEIERINNEISLIENVADILKKKPEEA